MKCQPLKSTPKNFPGLERITQDVSEKLTRKTFLIDLLIPFFFRVGFYEIIFCRSHLC